MEYDLSKTPHENILSEQPRIRRTATPEQPDSKINLGQFTSAPQSTPRDRYNAQIGPLSPRFSSIYDAPTGPPPKPVWDHDLAGKIELGMTLAGMGLMATYIGAPVGIVLLGAGTVVGVADALAYYFEGKPYDGTIMMALQLIPGNELMKGLSKYSPEFVKNFPKFQSIMEKMAKNETLTDLEKKIYKEGIEAFKKYFPELSPKLRKYSFLFLRSILKKLPLLTVMKFLRGLSKGSKFAGNLILKLFRISITFDGLWILLSTPEMGKIRDKSQFANFLKSLVYNRFTSDEIDNMWEVKNTLYNSDGTPNLERQQEAKDLVTSEEFLTGFVGLLDSLSMSDIENVDFKNVDDSEIRKWRENVRFKTDVTNVSSSSTIESILSGNQTVRKGQKGQVVGEIQKMLFFLGYDLGESGKDETGIDRDFGDSTEKAVIEFQKEYNLKDTTGVVGKETLSLLKKLYDEQKN